jgi:hypothetical protein
MTEFFLFGLFLFERLVFGLLSFPINSDEVVIQIDPTIQYQTITGWEATAQAGQTECDGFQNYQDELFDLAAGDLGINRLRLQVKSGAENQRDYWSDYQAGIIDHPIWRGVRYSTVNDNDNPFELNWDGFHFSELDDTVEKVILPMRSRLEANGEQLFVNLTYVAFTEQILPGLEYLHQDPEEYAEFIVAASLHLKEQYGLVPDTWEVILEPDNVSEWDGELVGKAIVAAAERLETNGFEPKFTAPSNADMGSAVSYFDEMMKVPGAAQYLGEFSYHRYRGTSAENLRAIAERGALHQIDTAMLEHIGGDHLELHTDLQDGSNASWQQFTLGYCGEEDNGGAYFSVDNQDPENPRVHIGGRTRYLRQYFKFIRRFAVRIGAQSSSKVFDPLAFINQDGGYVVIVSADSEGAFELRGLPGGQYGIKYTTSSEFDVDQPDIFLSNNQSVRLSIPEAGVLTVYGKKNGDWIFPFTPETQVYLPAVGVQQPAPEMTEPANTIQSTLLPAVSAVHQPFTTDTLKKPNSAGQRSPIWNMIGVGIVGLIICAGLAAAFLGKSRQK